MKLQTTIYLAAVGSFLALVVALPIKNDESYFTLKTKDGEETTGTMDEFNEVLRKNNPILEAQPTYGQILEDGYKKLDKDIDNVMKEGGDKEKILLITSNAIADMYEKLFAAAGMELKIHNRKPYVFKP